MRNAKKQKIEKRPVLVFLFVCILIAVLLTRLAYLQTGAPSAILTGKDEKRIEIDVSRGCIYDRNLVPLVNTGTRSVTAVLLNEETRHLFAGIEQLENTSAACVTLETERDLPETVFSKTIQTVVRYDENTLCAHILGYTDAGGSGVCGIEKSFDKILRQASGKIGVKYTANVYGQPIAGAGLQIVDESYNNAAGVVLTVDSRIQRIAENALSDAGVTRGAVVVLDADTSEILAMASAPAFDPASPGDSLTDENLPFLNRALAAYPVGSVFKPFVAAAALEHGMQPPSSYECAGSTAVGETVFRCYHSTAHGELDLSGAVCRSCNCYFIALGQALGAEAILETARDFGFGQEDRLTGDLIGAAGSLPQADAGPGELANLCFGQGELLASPLQLAAAFNTLASGGVYRAPYLMKALVDENKAEYAYYKNETEYRAMGERNSKIINECLMQNMREGTGRNGVSEQFLSAGKTATAQTGRYNESGEELLCTWFCGFFPYAKPEYTVVVFNEQGSSAAEDCAPVFREISEKIYLEIGFSDAF